MWQIINEVLYAARMELERLAGHPHPTGYVLWSVALYGLYCPVDDLIIAIADGKNIGMLSPGNPLPGNDGDYFAGTIYYDGIEGLIEDMLDKKNVSIARHEVEGMGLGTTATQHNPVSYQEIDKEQLQAMFDASRSKGNN